jgi:hypothetical protein
VLAIVRTQVPRVLLSTVRSRIKQGVCTRFTRLITLIREPRTFSKLSTLRKFRTMSYRDEFWLLIDLTSD